eukprot:Colp12_sorted_trinity150504_noHs@5469
MASIPEVMRAQILTGHGDCDKNEYREDFPVPIPKPGWALVRVHACAVNNTDIWTREGAYGIGDSSGWKPLAFPRIQGADIAGVVVKTTNNSLSNGQKVLVYPAVCENGVDFTDCEYLGSEVDGGFAEYCAVPEENLFPVADDCTLTFCELASFATAYMTALHMVNRADVRTGETVIVTGATGGVGLALTHLCKLRGARVVAVTDPTKAASVMAQGADDVIMRGGEHGTLLQQLKEKSQGRLADVVLDVVAGPMLMDLLHMLRPRGRYASAGAIAGPNVQVHWPTVYLKHLDILGCMLASREEFGQLVSLIVRGELRPVVSNVFPLAGLSDAQREFKTKKGLGKIVIDCA